VTRLFTVTRFSIYMRMFVLHLGSALLQESTAFVNPIILFNRAAEIN